jgi:hypothetical protein
MPWWLFLYLAVILTVVAFAIRDDLQEQTAMPIIIAEIFATLILIIAAVGYWLPSVVTFFGSGGQLIYCAAVTWLIVGTAREIRGISPKPSPLLSLGSILFYVILYSPLVYWGFLSVFGKV